MLVACRRELAVYRIGCLRQTNSRRIAPEKGRYQPSRPNQLGRCGRRHEAGTRSTRPVASLRKIHILRSGRSPGHRRARAGRDGGAVEVVDGRFVVGAYEAPAINSAFLYAKEAGDRSFPLARRRFALGAESRARAGPFAGEAGSRPGGGVRPRHPTPTPRRRAWADSTSQMGNLGLRLRPNRGAARPVGRAGTRGRSRSVQKCRIDSGGPVMGHKL